VENHPKRRDRLRAGLKRLGADGLLVTNFVNVTYLTGFTGDDSFLLVRPKGELLISDGRYVTQLGEECPNLELHVRPPAVSMLQAVAKVLRSAKIKRLAIEGDSISVSLRDCIAEKLPKLELVATSALVETLREIKDREEIAQLRDAIGYAQTAFEAIRGALRPQQSEKEIADQLDYQIRLAGAKASAFPTILAVGPRAALPHATPTDKRVLEGDFVLIDWGASGRLYRSDLTRVLVTGKISSKLARIYRAVLSAQTQAIAAIGPGVAARDVDAVARSVIAEAGFGRRFNHGLGHGLGLEVHESPRLAANSPTVLRPGMVVTVEPGIYLPGWGGVRIEDDVLVTRTGHEVLSNAPKQLEEMIVG
jgi:Xaa-Pro aminopeptidase